MPDQCGAGGALEALASSSLKPAGKPPPRPKGPLPDDSEQAERWVEVAERHDRWTCQYSAARAFDGDPASAWCEGRAGDGVGEVLVVEVAASGPTQIWIGMGKSPALFRANGRPRRIRVYLLVPRVAEPAQCSGSFRDLQVVGTREVELEDQNGYQMLPLPTEKREGARLVALEILSVRPGTKYRDTCITEVRPAPKE